MLPVTTISDNQFLTARVHLLPVRVETLTRFVLPSKSRPEMRERHRVTFDSAEQPRAFSCTCEAYARGLACWAAARALDVLVLLLANNVTVGRLDASGEGREQPAALDDTAADGDAPAPRRGPWDGRLVHKRTHRAPEPEGDAEAVLVGAQIVKRGKVERVGGFQI